MKTKLYLAGLVGVCLLFYVYYSFYNNEGFQNFTRNAMIIIEPRRHHLLKKVITNFDEHMDPSWELYVFHGESFREYAKECTAHITKRKVILIPLNTDDMTATDYNRMFKKKQFWDSVIAENILVFQTDSVLCGSSAKTINDYTSYGYIGCSYDDKTIGPNMFMHWEPQYEYYGIGGLSFRKKSFMLDCIYKNQDVPDEFPEDMFFSQCVAKSPNRPESAKVLNQFCTQFVYKEKSFGAHKTNIDLQNKTEFYDYCPEAIMLEDD
jgi:hypothetical protein